MNRRSKSKAKTYKSMCGAVCYNPACETPDEGLECHHIIPLKNGGDDSPENMIQLCHKCHKRLGLHSDYNAHREELLVWKFMIEDDDMARCAQHEKETAPITYIPLTHLQTNNWPKPVKCIYLSGGIWARRPRKI